MTFASLCALQLISRDKVYDSYVLRLGTPGVLKKRLIFMEVVGLCILQRKGWSRKNNPGMWVRIPHDCRIYSCLNIWC